MSPDGRAVATIELHVSEGPNRKLSYYATFFDLSTGGGQVCFRWHFGSLREAVNRPCFSPDGTRLATAHGDGTVKIWPVRQLLGQRSDD